MAINNKNNKKLTSVDELARVSPESKPDTVESTTEATEPSITTSATDDKSEKLISDLETESKAGDDLKAGQLEDKIGSLDLKSDSAENDKLSEKPISKAADTATTSTSTEVPAPSLPPRNQANKSPSPPPKPHRPLSPFSQAHLTLSEAFPTIEPKVVLAILIASSGLVDPAFNGLLSLSDPDYKLDERMIDQQQREVVAMLTKRAPLPYGKPPTHQGAPRGAANSKPAPPRNTSANYARQPQPQQQSHGNKESGLDKRAANRALSKADIEATIRGDSTQIEEDEKLARMLTAEYEAEQRRTRGRGGNNTRGGADASDDPHNRLFGEDGEYANNSFGNFENDNQSGPDHRYGYDYDDEHYGGRDYDEHGRERSFFDDELPQIQANFQKGFNETKEKVNSWVENLKKKIDGDDKNPGVFSNIFGGMDESSSHSHAGQGRRHNNEGDDYYNYRGYDQQQPRRRNHGFDRDPDEVDFNGIQMKDDSRAAANEGPRLPRRPMSGADNGQPRTEKSNSKWEPLQPTIPEPTKAGIVGAGVGAAGGLDASSKETAAAGADAALRDGAAAGDSAGNAGSSKKVPIKVESAEEEDPFFIGDSDDDDEEEEEVTKKSDITSGAK